MELGYVSEATGLSEMEVELHLRSVGCAHVPRRDVLDVSTTSAFATPKREMRATVGVRADARGWNGVWR